MPMILWTFCLFRLSHRLYNPLDLMYLLSVVRPYHEHCELFICSWKPHDPYLWLENRDTTFAKLQTSWPFCLWLEVHCKLTSWIMDIMVADWNTGESNNVLAYLIQVCDLVQEWEQLITDKCQYCSAFRLLDNEAKSQLCDWITPDW